MVISPDSEFFDYLKIRSGASGRCRSAMSTIILAIGLVLCVEGLVFALAPLRMEQILEALREITPEQRRLIGLVALALGVAMVWFAKSLGA